MDVDSTAISTINYDRERGRLRVRFVSGERYEYQSVPEEVCRDFLAADSKGRFFQREIRDRYRFRRLRR